MASSGAVSEIIEHIEVHEQVYNLDKSIATISSSKEDETDQRSFQLPMDNELDWILNTIDRKISRTKGPSRQKAEDLLQNCKKKRIGISHPSGIGISESVNLKQALRRLCISHAAEVASMKRLSLTYGSCSASEAETIEKLYVSLVLQVKEAASSAEEGRKNVMEASIVPDRNSGNSSESSLAYVLFKIPYTRNLISSHCSAASTIVMEQTTQNQGILASGPSEPAESSSAVEVIGIKGDGMLKTCVFDSKTSVKLGKTWMRSRTSNPVFRRKCCTTRKVKHMHVGKSGTSVESSETEVTGPLPIKTKMSCLKGFVSPACSNANTDTPLKTKGAGNVDNKLDVGQTSCINDKATGVKVIETSSSREKGECSQSSKSSICDYSSSNSISDDSHQSISGRNSSRPHMSKDARWVAIRNIVQLHGILNLKNFRLLKKLGYGDIGTVYLSELTGSDYLYALKVMDVDFLLSRKKMSRAQTEREILQMLDHPFLPTLYAHFTSDNLSCLVVEYCPGGDLHVLRQKQIGRCFSESTVRFYVAEVLLALEYLHMLGVIYRDLKPENILVREDGHIMLSDFDLSLRCKVNPILLRSSSSSSPETVKKLSGSCAENSCIDPLCLHPSWAPVSCFRPQLASSMPTNRKLKSDLAGHVFPLPQLVAEPTDARSNSFVGTHEYLAPEIIRGDGHGSAVDWWTFGIFLYELLFSRTPFKGSSNEVTLTNVVTQALKFPEIPSVSFHAKDLIRCLLVKEPENRIGSARGAAEIKQHPFFEGLNWALIRCSEPPELPGSYEAKTLPVLHKKREFNCPDFRSNADVLEFETF